MCHYSRLTTAAMVLATTGVLALSACSSSSGSHSDSSSTPASAPASAGSSNAGSSNVAVTAAKQVVKQYSAMQPAVVVKALTAKPASGKKVAIITCVFPSCLKFSDAGGAAAQKLGWDVKNYSEGSSIEAYVGAWDTALQGKPNFIFYVAGLPNALIAKELAEAQKNDIAVVAVGSAEAPSGAVRATPDGSASSTLTGKIMGSALVADSNGKANAVWVTDPGLKSTFGSLQSAMTQQVQAAGGQVAVLNVSGNDVGKSVPGTIVSYLQAHTGVKYVVTPVEAYFAGVPGALKSAGISNVKLLSQGPSASDLAQIKSGQQWATVAGEDETAAYRAIDVFVRISEGSPFDANPVGSHQLLTKDNVGTNVEPTTAGPSTQSVFYTAWHLN